MVAYTSVSPRPASAPAHATPPIPLDPFAPRPAPEPLVVESLRQSAIFRDYQQAFETATGLPLSLQSADSLGLAQAGSRHQNSFCTLVCGHNKSCSACLELQREVREKAVAGDATLTCHAGLLESGVPILIGTRPIAYLHVGQVLSRPPTAAGFRRVLWHLEQLGVKADPAAIETAYFATKVVDARQYESMLRLLTIFARHLAVISNQLMITHQPVDKPIVARAKAFIASHAEEPLSLGMVARAVNTSSFYFCKVFRRSTGIKFVDYVGRVRVERVKQLLMNPHSNISEAAYAAGFTSLSQFNRIFKRVVGEEPRQWREKTAA